MRRCLAFIASGELELWNFTPGLCFWSGARGGEVVSSEFVTNSDSIRKTRSGVATLLTETTPCRQPLSHGTEAACGRAMRLRFSAGGALRAQETSPGLFVEHRPSDGE